MAIKLREFGVQAEKQYFGSDGAGQISIQGVNHRNVLVPEGNGATWDIRKFRRREFVLECVKTNRYRLLLQRSR